MVDMGLYEEVERHSYVKFLDVRACGDYFLKFTFRFYISFKACPSHNIGYVGRGDLEIVRSGFYIQLV